MSDVELTVDRVRELLDYEPDTGIMRWRVQLNGRCRVGAIAGCVNSKGYRVVHIDGRQYRASRLVWLHVYGRWPTGVIDHRNHVTDDNRIANIRDVSVSVNAQNQIRAQTRSASGLLGVFPRGRLWRAKLKRADGSILFLGEFQTAQTAHAAYVAAKRMEHEGCEL